jgi:hypothetical protein
VIERREKKDKPPPRPVDEADVWEEEITELCAKAMAIWLKGSLHLSRPINSLTRTELKNLARTAVHVWIAAASERVTQTPDPVEKAKLNRLLLG